MLKEKKASPDLRVLMEIMVNLDPSDHKGFLETLVLMENLVLLDLVVLWVIQEKWVNQVLKVSEDCPDHVGVLDQMEHQDLEASRVLKENQVHLDQDLRDL